MILQDKIIIFIRCLLIVLGISATLEINIIAIKKKDWKTLVLFWIAFIVLLYCNSN